MAVISSTVSLNVTSSGNSGLEMDRISYNSIPLPLHHFYNTHHENDASDNANDNSSSQGTVINADSSLILTAGMKVTSGTWLIRGSNTANGGLLRLDGASLTCTRLLLAGNINGNLALTPASDASRRPVLDMRNGSILYIAGSQAQAWRMFMGNHTQGRLLIDDSTIYFSNASLLTGDFDSGTTRGNLFLGYESQITNSKIQGMNKIELLGRLHTFNNVTLQYDTNGDIVGDSGCIYMAGNANIVSELGTHSVIMPTTGLTLYDTSGDDFFKYMSIRNVGCKITLNGQITLVPPNNTSNFQPRCHDFYFQGNTFTGLDATYVRQGTLNASVTRQTHLGAPLTGAASSDTKVAMIDNRDIFQWSGISSNFTNGVLTPQTYTWHNMPMYSIIANRGDSLVAYGYPTGKAATAPGAVNGSGHIYYERTLSDIRENGRVFHASADATLTTENSAPGIDGLANRDLRRFYPFRIGYHQWGDYPEFINSGLGEERFLGISGNGISNTNINVENLELVEAGANDIRNGKTQALVSTADPVMSGVSLADALGRSVTMTSPTGVTGSLIAEATADDLSLDHIYQRTQRWIYDNVTDQNDTYTATAPSVIHEALATNNGVASVSDSGTINFYTQASPSNTDTSAAANTAWDELNYVRVVTGSRLFSRVGQNADTYTANYQAIWKEGYLYFYIDSSNWGLYSFTRQATESGPDSSHGASITPIAWAGNIQADNSTVMIQRAQLIDTPSVAGANAVRSYLWAHDMGLRPAASNGNVMEVKRMSVRNGSTGTNIDDNVIIPGTHLNTINLDSNSNFNCESKQIAVNITGTGTITEVPADSTVTLPVVRAGVTIGSGVTMTLQAGATYNIAGDISAASFTVTGDVSEHGNAILQAVGDGVLPSGDITNVTKQKIFSITFRGATGDTWNVSDGFHIQNAVFTTSQSGSTYLTTPTPSTSGTDLIYTFNSDPDHTIYYAFAGRKADGGQWYDPVYGTTTGAATVQLVETNTAVVPETVTSETGMATQDTWFETDGRVGALTAAVSNSNNLMITVSDTATTGSAADGKYITRLMMQQTNFLRAIAKGYWTLPRISVLADRVVYTDTNVTWQRSGTGSTNIIELRVQVLDSRGLSANLDITTTATNTYVRFSPATNAGFIDPQTLATLATKSDVEEAAFL